MRTYFSLTKFVLIHLCYIKLIIIIISSKYVNKIKINYFDYILKLDLYYTCTNVKTRNNIIVDCK